MSLASLLLDPVKHKLLVLNMLYKLGDKHTIGLVESGDYSQLKEYFEENLFSSEFHRYKCVDYVKTIYKKRFHSKKSIY